MARKAKPKAAQWLQVEGQWVKAPVTVCRPVSWTYGLKSGGWEARGRCNMAERSHFHRATVRGTLLKENI